MKSSLFILFLLMGAMMEAQIFTISGKITSEEGAMPFATILVKGTTMGTNSNTDGDYSLKLNAGTYDIVYQYVGYAKRTERVLLQADKKMNITLSPEGVALKEVQINAGEDPSYPIIRKAIKKRRYYRNQVAQYSCRAYIRGLQKITALPKNIKSLIKIVGGDESDTADIKGIIYLSESESRYYYKKPDKEKEIMQSSKVSGDNQSFSFNQLSDVSINFNDKLVQMGGISNRPFVSPLHDNAFLFYRFFLLGKITSEGKTINKIKVVPKSASDPCFRGILYIQDSTWRITGVDFMVTSATKINFVDTLFIRQINAPVIKDSVWMPVTLNLTFIFKVFGIMGNGYFNASILEYDLATPIDDKFFTNEVFRVERGANERDSAYWNKIRTIPLTTEEKTDYRKKDSVSSIRNTKRYRDSVDRVHNRFRFMDIFMGYTYNNSSKKLSYSLPGIITNGVQFNTVEGLNLSYRMSVTKVFEDKRRWQMNGKVRYGFSNQLFGGELSSTWFYKPRTFGYGGINFKSITEQFNKQEPIAPIVNSLYTLLGNRNYMKLYRETGVEAYYYKEVVNGFYFTPVVAYLQRDPLFNTTDFLFIDDGDRFFSSNVPDHPYNTEHTFVSNRSLTAEFTFSFRFKQRYYTLPDEKIITGSRYPRLNINFKKAFPLAGATADYDYAGLTLWHSTSLGLVGRFAWRLKGGAFLTSASLPFVDFKHFIGNQTFINTNDYLSSFRLLPYYSFSADQWFAEAHAEHHFRGFIIDKLPWVKKLRVQEVAGFHFLTTNRLRYYYEVNFGLERLFKIVRFDYILAYSSAFRFDHGFTAGLMVDF
jgi:hypothetical protein